MRSPNQGYQKALSIKTKKFRGFNSDWLLIIKINAGMVLLSNKATTRLYQITAMLKIPIDFSKKQRCVSSLMHISKSEFKILYSISSKIWVKNSLDALEMVLTSNNSHI